MARDLLLLAAPPSALEEAAERGYWGPLTLPAAACDALTHLAVLPPKAKWIDVVVPILDVTPWPDPRPSARKQLLIGPTTPLRRPIPVGRGRVLARWRPRQLNQPRLVVVSDLLFYDSLAEYLELLSPEERRRSLMPLGEGDPR
ncbi:MAG: hypothetical protein ACK55D_12135 [Synechococcaceae cyanobacterium]|jgi:hypothetical protein